MLAGNHGPATGLGQGAQGVEDGHRRGEGGQAGGQVVSQGGTGLCVAALIGAGNTGAAPGQGQAAEIQAAGQGAAGDVGQGPDIGGQVLEGQGHGRLQFRRAG